MTNKPLCIYHGNCADGFGAAWVVWKHFKGEVDLYPGVYQEPPPDVKGRTVYIVDFSYKRPVMEQLIKDAAFTTVLDHHKSAIEDLSPLLETLRKANEFGKLAKALMVFDTTRSGTMIAWDYFFPLQDPPQLLKHIQDAYRMGRRSFYGTSISIH